MSTPHVSIILPTYNRADTLGRAIESVTRQTFEDWELLIIDDGSTDDSEARCSGLDPRIRWIRQDNAGTYVARNRGLELARGRRVTFLDSDDAWKPHFLALTTGVLDHCPDARFVTTEFFQDFGGHAELRDRHPIGGPYAAFARAIGSNRLDLPPGETDDYLRVYSHRSPLPPAVEAIAQAAGHGQAQLYRGQIFNHMRWGYLNWLPVTMLTREALETVGRFATRTRNAADFQFMGRLARHFEAHMVTAPLAIKYEKAQGNAQLAQDHLATGANLYSFEVNKLSYFDELFGEAMASDPELVTVRRHYELYAGLAALRRGERLLARGHLGRAEHWSPHLRRAYAWHALARLAPSDAAAARLMSTWLRGYDIGSRVWSGDISLSKVGRKLLARHT